MAKVIYEFDMNDPDDAGYAALYRDAPQLFEAVKSFSGRLRNTLKYSQSLTEQEARILEAVKKAFYNAMMQNDVSVDTFSDQGAIITWEGDAK